MRAGAVAPHTVAPPPVDDQSMAQRPPERPPNPAPDTHDSDEALAARLRGRDAAALAGLYDRYAAAVHALATHTLGPADAEEVVQDVFLSLWRRAGQFDPQRGAFGAWFMALARHRVLDELRRRGAQQRLRAAVAVEHLLATAAGDGPGAASVEEAVWQRERGAAVLSALRQLPEAQRRVLVLSYFGGLSHAALAAHLDWPLGTVKKRLRLGLQKLRAALGRYAPQGDAAGGPDDPGRGAAVPAGGEDER
jgi:RNA polymerase sigma-70 factor, ECF subfamily